MSWGYAEHNGPSTWVRDFPDAGLSHQSPINIVTSEAVHDVTLQVPVVKYEAGDVTYVKRSAHGVEWVAEKQNSTLTGGPLQGTYRLAQFHFHWAPDNGTGSEHTVDGRPYAAELHLVHYNADRYQSVAEAAPHADGLAVLGVLIEAGAEHAGFDLISRHLLSVTYKDQESRLTSPFNPASMLPDDLSKYWTYPGSLTTPPCYQSVRWILFKNPVRFSSKQLELFRSLHDENTPSAGNCANDSCRLLLNYRPPQPLNDRQILASFEE